MNFQDILDELKQEKKTIEIEFSKAILKHKTDDELSRLVKELNVKISENELSTVLMKICKTAMV